MRCGFQHSIGSHLIPGFQLSDGSHVTLGFQIENGSQISYGLHHVDGSHNLSGFQISDGSQCIGWFSALEWLKHHQVFYRKMVEYIHRHPCEDMGFLLVNL